MRNEIEAAILLLIQNGYSVSKKPIQTNETNLAFEGHENSSTGALTVPEFINRFKVGRTKAYEEIDSGRLATYKVGRRRYISAKAVADWQSKAERDQIKDL